MYISKISLTNFKSFSGKHELTLKSGINFFVGNNNAGKTTIFKAIEFIQNCKNKDEWITVGREEENVAVEIVFSGNDIALLVEQDSLSKYKDFVFEEKGIKTLKILRDSMSHEWTPKT